MREERAVVLRMRGGVRVEHCADLGFGVAPAAYRPGDLAPRPCQRSKWPEIGKAVSGLHAWFLDQRSGWPACRAWLQGLPQSVALVRVASVFCASAAATVVP